MGFFRDLEEEEYTKRRAYLIKYVAHSGLVRFALEQDNCDPALKTVLGEYTDLPLTYFRTPKDEAQRVIMYEMVGKLLRKSGCEEAVAQSGVTYFVTADRVKGEATKGLLACDKGILHNSVGTKFTPREEIAGFSADKKGWICVERKEKLPLYFSGLDNKPARAESERFLSLLRALYC